MTSWYQEARRGHRVGLWQLTVSTPKLVGHHQLTAKCDCPTLHHIERGLGAVDFLSCFERVDLELWHETVWGRFASCLELDDV